MDHIVFAGNPGVGKSTLLNSLVGRHIFDSGVAVGSGLTKNLQQHEHNGVVYCDTPGLDDAVFREQAARKISEAISAAASLKLVFVVTLQSGRVVPADAATIEVILKAVEALDIDVRGRFALIINKCSPVVLNGLREQGVLPFLVNMLTGGRGAPQHVLCRPLEPGLRERDNSVSAQCADVREFVRRVPVIAKHGQAVEVDAADYAEKERQKEEELQRLTEELRRLERAQKMSKWGSIVLSTAVSLLGGPALSALGARGTVALLALL